MTIKELKAAIAACDDNDVIAVVVDDNEYSNHLLRLMKSDDSKITFFYIKTDETLDDDVDVTERES